MRSERFHRILLRGIGMGKHPRKALREHGEMTESGCAANVEHEGHSLRWVLPLKLMIAQPNLRNFPERGPYDDVGGRSSEFENASSTF